MRTITTSSGTPLDLDGDVLAVLETVSRDLIRLRALDYGFEDVDRAFAHLVSQMSEDELRAYLKGRVGKELVWPGRWFVKAADMLRADLMAADVPVEIDGPEGIETRDQLQVLQALECQFGQGYYIGRPMTAEQAAVFKTDFGTVAPAAA